MLFQEKPSPIKKEKRGDSDSSSDSETDQSDTDNTEMEDDYVRPSIHRSKDRKRDRSKER